MADDPFPKWGEQATKGDLIMTLSAVHSCIVDIYISLISLKVDNKEKLAEYVEKLDVSSDSLHKLIYKIGGKEFGDD